MASGVNSTNSLRRILVGIKALENSGTVKLAKFVDCLVKCFAPNSLSVNVGCKLEDNMLVLYHPNTKSLQNNLETTAMEDKVHSREASDFGIVLLQHSPACPVMMMMEEVEVINSIPEDTTSRGVHVGVAVILESSDSHILLTQRADHMRSFPGAWVPPGGNIECGESLVEGGLRELLEETGLSLRNPTKPVFDGQAPVDSRILCIWESVFPAFLPAGLPRYHHAAVYIHITVSQNRDQLQDAVKLDPSEVQACVWLSKEDIHALVAGEAHRRTVVQWKMTAGGNLEPKLHQLSSMFRAPWVGDPLTGVQAALHGWLRFKNSFGGGGKTEEIHCNKIVDNCRM